MFKELKIKDELTAQYFNLVNESFELIIKAAGLKPTEEDLSQLGKAISIITKKQVFLDIGTPTLVSLKNFNDYIPLPTTLVDGFVLNFKNRFSREGVVDLRMPGQHNLKINFKTKNTGGKFLSFKYSTQTGMFEEIIYTTISTEDEKAIEADIEHRLTSFKSIINRYINDKPVPKDFGRYRDTFIEDNNIDYIEAEVVPVYNPPSDHGVDTLRQQAVSSANYIDGIKNKLDDKRALNDRIGEAEALDVEIEDASSVMVDISDYSTVNNIKETFPADLNSLSLREVTYKYPAGFSGKPVLHGTIADYSEDSYVTVERVLKKQNGDLLPIRDLRITGSTISFNYTIGDTFAINNLGGVITASSSKAVTVTNGTDVIVFRHNVKRGLDYILYEVVKLANDEFEVKPMNPQPFNPTTYLVKHTPLGSVKLNHFLNIFEDIEQGTYRKITASNGLIKKRDDEKVILNNKYNKLKNRDFNKSLSEDYIQHVRDLDIAMTNKINEIKSLVDQIHKNHFSETQAKIDELDEILEDKLSDINDYMDMLDDFEDNIMDINNYPIVGMEDDLISFMEDFLNSATVISKVRDNTFFQPISIKKPGTTWQVTSGSLHKFGFYKVTVIGDNALSGRIVVGQDTAGYYDRPLIVKNPGLFTGGDKYIALYLGDKITFIKNITQTPTTDKKTKDTEILGLSFNNLLGSFKYIQTLSNPGNENVGQKAGTLKTKFVDAMNNLHIISDFLKRVFKDMSITPYWQYKFYHDGDTTKYPAYSKNKFTTTERTYITDSGSKGMRDRATKLKTDYYAWYDNLKNPILARANALKQKADDLIHTRTPESKVFKAIKDYSYKFASNSYSLFEIAKRVAKSQPKTEPIDGHDYDISTDIAVMLPTGDYIPNLHGTATTDYGFRLHGESDFLTVPSGTIQRGYLGLGGAIAGFLPDGFPVLQGSGIGIHVFYNSPVAFSDTGNARGAITASKSGTTLTFKEAIENKTSTVTGVPNLPWNILKSRTITTSFGGSYVAMSSPRANIYENSFIKKMAAKTGAEKRVYTASYLAYQCWRTLMNERTSPNHRKRKDGTIEAVGSTLLIDITNTEYRPGSFYVYVPEVDKNLFYVNSDYDGQVIAINSILIRLGYNVTSAVIGSNIKPGYYHYFEMWDNYDEDDYFYLYFVLSSIESRTMPSNTTVYPNNNNLIGKMLYDDWGNSTWASCSKPIKNPHNQLHALIMRSGRDRPKLKYISIKDEDDNSYLDWTLAYETHQGDYLDMIVQGGDRSNAILVKTPFYNEVDAGYVVSFYYHEDSNNRYKVARNQGELAGLIAMGNFKRDEIPSKFISTSGKKAPYKEYFYVCQSHIGVMIQVAASPDYLVVFYTNGGIKEYKVPLLIKQNVTPDVMLVDYETIRINAFGVYKTVKLIEK